MIFINRRNTRNNNINVNRNLNDNIIGIMPILHSKQPIVNKEVKIDIFNFGMEKVFSKIYNLNSYYGALKWDGRDIFGNHVANGVYFIRLNFASSRNQAPGDNWTKLIIVK